jgi:hypothetical protein
MPRNSVDDAELRILRQELLEAHRELNRLRTQNEQLVGSNRDLSSLLTATDKRSGELVKIIVAFRRLLDSESAHSALRCIEEIVVTIIGSENFVVLLLDERDAARPVAGFGDALTEAHVLPPSLDALHRSAARLVPLYIADQLVGAIAIAELLPHREALNHNDDQVLNLLSRYAASVIMAAIHRKEWRRVQLPEVA